MAEIIRTEEPVTRTTGGAPGVIYVIFGILEALLAFRLVFKLLGANPNSGFVAFIYGLTQPLVAPFYGIFPQATTTGVTTTATFEPATLIAMLVYALIGWGLTVLVASLTRRRV
jgi:hypothetical protein